MRAERALALVALMGAWAIVTAAAIARSTIAAKGLSALTTSPSADSS